MFGPLDVNNVTQLGFRDCTFSSSAPLLSRTLSPVALEESEGLWGSLGSHVEKAYVLMALAAESPGFALRNFTESVHPLRVDVV